jgi:hypothetical protein
MDAEYLNPKTARPTSDFFTRKERHRFLAFSRGRQLLGTYLLEANILMGVSMGRPTSLYFLLE